MSEKIETLAGRSVLNSLLVLVVVNFSTDSDYKSEFDEIAKGEKLLICWQKGGQKASFCLATAEIKLADAQFGS